MNDKIAATYFIVGLIAIFCQLAIFIWKQVGSVLSVFWAVIALIILLWVARDISHISQK